MKYFQWNESLINYNNNRHIGLLGIINNRNQPFRIVRDGNTLKKFIEKYIKVILL